MRVFILGVFRLCLSFFSSSHLAGRAQGILHEQLAVDNRFLRGPLKQALVVEHCPTKCKPPVWLNCVSSICSHHQIGVRHIPLIRAHWVGGRPQFLGCRMRVFGCGCTSGLLAKQAVPWVPSTGSEHNSAKLLEEPSRVQKSPSSIKVSQSTCSFRVDRHGCRAAIFSGVLEFTNLQSIRPMF